jgi:shikimate dehydrogenase
LRAAGGYTPVPDAHGVVLGAGGTASAALAGFASLGVSRATVVLRDVNRSAGIRECASRLGLPLSVVAWSSADFASLGSSAAVLVSTTPSSAVSSLADSLALAGCVLDVIYHPWPTPLAAAVLARGGRVATGLDMLLHQAFAQVSQFTGLPAPRSAMRDALRAETGNQLALPLD